MIFIILILSAAATAFFFILARKKWQRRLSFVFAFLFILSIGLSVANFNQHFGMSQKTSTQTLNLVSSVKGQDTDALLYKPLGDGTEKVYLYQTEKMDEPKSTASQDVKNHINQDADQAQLTIKTTEWVYKNDFYQTLFAMAGNNHEFIRQDNQFDLPSDWQVISAE
ncbi:MAG: DUF4811 domain-containing protein [Tetragenococcus halophilus]|nr:DUF4811 domain-containing protein [Tetragenococcus halophilus]